MDIANFAKKRPDGRWDVYNTHSTRIGEFSALRVGVWRESNHDHDTYFVKGGIEVRFENECYRGTVQKGTGIGNTAKPINKEEETMSEIKDDANDTRDDLTVLLEHLGIVIVNQTYKDPATGASKTTKFAVDVDDNEG